ncbi:hypothetical protein [Actinomycetospora succinea]|uniref:hypothetical protein n=1 Tax=Actinomycetospora succinea TaxID=663603 RepID=UPI00105C258E|nr:hypothetical protein [Actinomycetospora succinea]
MSAAQAVAWWVLGALWLLTSPGVLVAFAAVGDPPPGFRPGWVMAFLGWLSIPVTVVGALVAEGPWTWLPLASVAALPVGYLVMRVGIRIARRPRSGP